MVSYLLLLYSFTQSSTPLRDAGVKPNNNARSNCNYTMNGLRETVPIALESVTVDLIRQYFRNVRDYQKAYIEVMTGNEADKQVKIMYAYKNINMYIYVYFHIYILILSS